MPLTVDWQGASATPPYRAIVTIPQTYENLTLVSGTAPNGVWVLDTLAFWDDLKALEASEEGIVFPDLQAHNSAYTAAGVTYADAILMQAKVTFYNPVADEDWTVVLEGSNNDLFDVAEDIYIPTPHLALVPNNSAGLIRVETGTSGLTPTESQALLDIDTNVDTLLTNVVALLLEQGLTNDQKEAQHVTSRLTGKVILRNTTVSRRWEADAWEDEAMTIPYGTNGNVGIEAVGMLVEVAWS